MHLDFRGPLICVNNIILMYINYIVSPHNKHIIFLVLTFLLFILYNYYVTSELSM